MFNRTMVTSGVALTAVAAFALTACDDADGSAGGQAAPAASAQAAAGNTINGTTKITVDGKSIAVSCSGSSDPGRPVVVLLAGLGDGLDKLAGFQKTLSARNRVCSYDRLGEGTSDQPDGPQTIESTGKILTGVLDQVAGNRPVVLAAHSLGGLIAARYTPDHLDRVKGVVLMDATPPTMGADIARIIPESATGNAGEARAQFAASAQGQNPEMLATPDGAVRSAGDDLPVEVIRHGQPYLGQVAPEYGQALEDAWAAGEQKWLGLSSNSKISVADKSDHYIYVNQPDLAAQVINRVTDEATQ